jgi:hypothetical protein
MFRDEQFNHKRGRDKDDYVRFSFTSLSVIPPACDVSVWKGRQQDS